MGEQGAESIHKEINDLAKNFQNIPERAEKLHHILQQHYLGVHPHNLDLCPPIKKRKVSN